MQITYSHQINHKYSIIEKNEQTKKTIVVYAISYNWLIGRGYWLCGYSIVKVIVHYDINDEQLISLGNVIAKLPRENLDLN